MKTMVFSDRAWEAKDDVEALSYWDVPFSLNKYAPDILVVKTGTGHYEDLMETVTQYAGDKVTLDFEYFTDQVDVYKIRNKSGKRGRRERYMTLMAA